ncbi:hypothetical protein BDD12DRAFT_909511 [Trichophaea hybrida]|nr:hypothetical protein BDD12DRAFT_909511 [Trichophaea hybrida]
MAPVPKGADIRWNIKIILPTLFFQLLTICIIIGLSSTLYPPPPPLTFPTNLQKKSLDSVFSLSISPLSLSIASIISLIAHIICYFTSSLHPLVVLAFAIEFMLVWIANTVFAFIYARGPRTGCVVAVDGSYYQQDSKSICRKSSAILALTVIITVSYIWLVTYSAMVRKKAAMPYVLVEERSVVPVVMTEAPRSIDGTAAPVAAVRNEGHDVV